MKQLYLVAGTMGVGKTTVCQALKRKLARSVFLDGDWCWDMHPFQVTDETKEMVMQNICFLLNSFLHCSAFEHVIFCWVMHEQAILDEILSRLDLENCAVHAAALICSEDALRRRLQKDIDTGLRQPDVLERSLARLPLYGKLKVRKIDVSAKSAEETAQELAELK